jgi:hypothetical protein
MHYEKDIRCTEGKFLELAYVNHSERENATGDAAEMTGTYFISFGSNTARFTSWTGLVVRPG